jgi:hypothetical protein
MHEMDVSLLPAPQIPFSTYIHHNREIYTNQVDKKVWDHDPSSKWLTAGHTFIKTNGETITGGDAAFTSLSKEVYAPFSEHLHDPEFLVAWETSDGWGMLGQATLYWNLAVKGDGKGGVKDKSGKQWDGAGPAAFRFGYVKGKDGIRLDRTEIMADSAGAVVAMLKRGMMKPEDLLG